MTPIPDDEENGESEEKFVTFAKVNAVAESGTEHPKGNYTIYFVPPEDWTKTGNVEIYFRGRRGAGSGNNDGEYKAAMTKSGEIRKTDGRPIYKIELSSANGSESCPNGGYVWVRFQVGEDDTASKWITIRTTDNDSNSWLFVDEMGGKCFEGDKYFEGNDKDKENIVITDAAAVSKLAAYDDIVKKHVRYGGQKIYFQNKTENALTNITVTFYEKDGATYKKVGGEQTISSVPAEGVSDAITIPSDPCAYVRFTDAGGNTIGKPYYNFYNDEDASDKVGTFQYNAKTNDCFIYNGLSDVQWGAPNATRVYFDATFSDMSYQNDSGTKDGMPGTDGKLYYILTGTDKPALPGEMTRLEDRSESRHLWYVNAPEGYTSVQFSDTETPPTPTDKINGRATDTLTWGDLKEPCFYADTGDDITYGGKYRDGYWDEKSEIRDAEAGKKKVDSSREPVVNLEKKAFTQQANTKYISTTLYDYYTDYELNGNNRANNKCIGEYNSQRSYVTFEQFDRALSNYYSEYATNNTPIQYPLYTGHFQPSNLGDNNRFANIANNLGLYGWGLYDRGATEESQKSYWRFIAANNSNYNAAYDANTGNDYSTHGNSAFQGLVNTDLTSDGSPTIAGTTLVEPHFNEAFLTGANKAKAVLGKVYKDVAFPFKQAPVFADPGNDNDPEKEAQYWYFDSNKTSLYLKQDGKDYYLEGDGTNQNSLNRNASNDANSGFGFFPFNQYTTNGGANQYNYGFGAKLQFDFTLTDDGNVVVGKNADEKVPIKFFFSGDDDVWVFIDNKLVLDVGGAHGRVDGLLEFGEAGDKNTVTAYVSDAKAGQTAGFGITYDAMTTPKNVTFNKDKNNPNDSAATRTFRYQSNANNQMLLTKNTKHTLTMYYMERGMWESNMAVAFNFPDHNELQVEKQVDATDVRGLLKTYFTKSTRQFTVSIKNWATHYAALNPTATTDAGGGSGIGFTTKQYTIPDYGSVEKGQLVDAVGAQYTTSNGEEICEVKSDGKFTLQNGETVTFADQFRRGSYISLQEDLQEDADKKLYAPAWEIYENGKLVTQSNDGTTVKLPDGTPQKIMQGDGTTPDDGRKEVYQKGNDEDGVQMDNTGYTETQKPENSIVFRSYSDPDGTNQFTKLKVKFINKVKTGSLSITKLVPDDELATLGKETYTFTVQYSNIGGMNLEGDNVVTETVEVPVGKPYKLDKIPIGTKVTITEKTPENQYIKSITVDGTLVDGNEACVNIGDNIGEDEKGTNGNTVPSVRVVFTNTARKPITITVKKTWQNAEGGELTDGLPTSIWVKLQRRHEGSTSDTDWENVQGTEVELTNGTWKHTFTGMDAYDINGPIYYEYRVMESAAKDGKYTADGTLKLGDYNYKVTSEKKTITKNVDSASLTLTNKQVPPVYELAITKQGLDENGNNTGPLNGVEFKLEKLNGNKVDTTFNNNKGFMPGTTAGDGNDAGKYSFENLSAGSYRLTELKTVDGYNLLAAPIEFTLQNDECLINGTKQEYMVTGTPAKGYTVSLTINNRKGFTLPHTGADAPSLWLLIGLPLLVAGLLVLVFRYNRKGGKRS